MATFREGKSSAVDPEKVYRVIMHMEMDLKTSLQADNVQASLRSQGHGAQSVRAANTEEKKEAKKKPEPCDATKAGRNTATDSQSAQREPVSNPRKHGTEELLSPEFLSALGSAAVVNLDAARKLLDARKELEMHQRQRQEDIDSLARLEAEFFKELRSATEVSEDAARKLLEACTELEKHQRRRQGNSDSLARLEEEFLNTLGSAAEVNLDAARKFLEARKELEMHKTRLEEPYAETDGTCSSSKHRQESTKQEPLSTSPREANIPIVSNANIQPGISRRPSATNDAPAQEKKTKEIMEEKSSPEENTSEHTAATQFQQATESGSTSQCDNVHARRSTVGAGQQPTVTDTREANSSNLEPQSHTNHNESKGLHTNGTDGTHATEKPDEANQPPPSNFDSHTDAEKQAEHAQEATPQPPPGKDAPEQEHQSSAGYSHTNDDESKGLHTNGTDGTHATEKPEEAKQPPPPNFDSHTDAEKQAEHAQEATPEPPPGKDAPEQEHQSSAGHSQTNDDESKGLHTNGTDGTHATEKPDEAKQPPPSNFDSHTDAEKQAEHAQETTPEPPPGKDAPEQEHQSSAGHSHANDDESKGLHTNGTDGTHATEKPDEANQPPPSNFDSHTDAEKQAEHAQEATSEPPPGKGAPEQEHQSSAGHSHTNDDESKGLHTNGTDGTHATEKPDEANQPPPSNFDSHTDAEKQAEHAQETTPEPPPGKDAPEQEHQSSAGHSHTNDDESKGLHTNGTDGTHATEKPDEANQPPPSNFDSHTDAEKQAEHAQEATPEPPPGKGAPEQEHQSSAGHSHTNDDESKGLHTNGTDGTHATEKPDEANQPPPSNFDSHTDAEKQAEHAQEATPEPPPGKDAPEQEHQSSAGHSHTNDDESKGLHTNGTDGTHATEKPDEANQPPPSNFDSHTDAEKQAEHAQEATPEPPPGKDAPGQEHQSSAGHSHTNDDESKGLHTNGTDGTHATEKPEEAKQPPPPNFDSHTDAEKQAEHAQEATPEPPPGKDAPEQEHQSSAGHSHTNDDESKGLHTNGTDGTHATEKPEEAKQPPPPNFDSHTDAEKQAEHAQEATPEPPPGKDAPEQEHQSSAGHSHTNDDESKGLHTNGTDGTHATEKPEEAKQPPPPNFDSHTDAEKQAEHAQEAMPEPPPGKDAPGQEHQSSAGHSHTNDDESKGLHTNGTDGTHATEKPDEANQPPPSNFDSHTDAEKQAEHAQEATPEPPPGKGAPEQEHQSSAGHSHTNDDESKGLHTNGTDGTHATEKPEEAKQPPPPNFDSHTDAEKQAEHAQEATPEPPPGKDAPEQEHQSSAGHSHTNDDESKGLHTNGTDGTHATEKPEEAKQPPPPNFDSHTDAEKQAEHAQEAMPEPPPGKDAPGQEHQSSAGHSHTNDDESKGLHTNGTDGTHATEKPDEANQPPPSNFDSHTDAEKQAEHAQEATPEPPPGKGAPEQEHQSSAGHSHTNDDESKGLHTNGTDGTHATEKPDEANQPPPSNFDSHTDAEKQAEHAQEATPEPPPGKDAPEQEHQSSAGHSHTNDDESKGLHTNGTDGTHATEKPDEANQPPPSNFDSHTDAEKQAEHAQEATPEPPPGKDAPGQEHQSSAGHSHTNDDESKGLHTNGTDGTHATEKPEEAKQPPPPNFDSHTDAEKQAEHAQEATPEPPPGKDAPEQEHQSSAGHSHTNDDESKGLHTNGTDGTHATEKPEEAKQPPPPNFDSHTDAEKQAEHAQEATPEPPPGKDAPEQEHQSSAGHSHTNDDESKGLHTNGTDGTHATEKPEEAKQPPPPNFDSHTDAEKQAEHAQEAMPEPPPGKDAPGQEHQSSAGHSHTNDDESKGLHTNGTDGTHATEKPDEANQPPPSNFDSHTDAEKQAEHAQEATPEPPPGKGAPEQEHQSSAGHSHTNDDESKGLHTNGTNGTHATEKPDEAKQPPPSNFDSHTDAEKQAEHAPDATIELPLGKYAPEQEGKCSAGTGGTRPKVQDDGKQAGDDVCRRRPCGECGRYDETPSESLARDSHRAVFKRCCQSFLRSTKKSLEVLMLLVFLLLLLLLLVCWYLLLTVFYTQRIDAFIPKLKYPNGPPPV